MTGLIIPLETFDTFSPGSKDPGIVLVSFDHGAGRARRRSRRSRRR